MFVAVNSCVHIFKWYICIYSVSKVQWIVEKRKMLKKLIGSHWWIIPCLQLRGKSQWPWIIFLPIQACMLYACSFYRTFSKGQSIVNLDKNVPCIEGPIIELLCAKIHNLFSDGFKFTLAIRMTDKTQWLYYRRRRLPVTFFTGITSPVTPNVLTLLASWPIGIRHFSLFSDHNVWI